MMKTGLQEERKPATGPIGARGLVLRSVAAPLQELFRPPSGQNAALDVLRSVAILLVVSMHSTVPYLEAGLAPNLFTRLPFVRAGWIGVDLFFVLSGYLIGRQLWRELQGKGTIDFRRFMIRRGLRIWPLWYAALAATLLIVHPGEFGWARWWPDAVFLSNYLGGVVEGGWSLCVEEHFYLAAPLLLIIAAPRLRSPAAFRPLLLALLAVLPALRAVAWWRLLAHDPSAGPEVRMTLTTYPTHLHADGLIVGLLLANLEATGSLKAGGGWLSSRWVVPGGFVLCGLCYAASAKAFNFTGLALAFGSLVCFCLPRSELMPGFVRSRAFYLLSRLSYGMYLNHMWMRTPVFEFLRARVVDPAGHPVLFSSLSFAVLVLLSGVLAVATFCLIEHPFLALRERLLAHKPARAVPETST